MRVAESISLTASEKRKLERIVQSRAESARLIERSRIVLLASEGLQNNDIAERIGSNSIKVGRWRKRFAALGFPGIERDAYRPGRIPALGDDVVARVITKTTQEKPTGATHWSAARLGKELAISESSVLRIWRSHGLRPDKIRTFKISRDQTSPRSSRTSSASISRRPNTRSCFASMRRARFKRWTGLSLECRSNADAPEQ